MFWKLALVVVLPLLLFGRAGVMSHPLVRVLLPRSWASAIPVVQPRAKPAGERPQPSALGTRLYVALLVLAAVAVASWMVTRALISGG